MELKKSELGNCYAFLDPSGAKNQILKRVSARSAIVVVQECLEDSLLVTYAWAEKCSTDTLTDKIFEVGRVFQPKQFGIESNAMQSLYVDSVIREARKNHVIINLVPWHQPTHIEKTFRIRTTLQPWFAHGKILIRDTLLELKNELQAFPTGTLRDLADALASAVAMVPVRQRDSGLDSELLALANYMRLAGYGPNEILRRLHELQDNRQGTGFNVARFMRERGRQEYGQ